MLCYSILVYSILVYSILFYSILFKGLRLTAGRRPKGKGRGSRFAYVGPMLAYVSPMLAPTLPTLALSWSHVSLCWPYVCPILPLCWPGSALYWPYVAPSCRQILPKYVKTLQHRMFSVPGPWTPKPRKNVWFFDSAKTKVFATEGPETP